MLQKPHTKLLPEERIEVDQWVSNQFRRKNFKLKTSSDLVLACDRTPLDPLVFVDERELQDRALDHLQILQPKEDGQQLLSGHIILLTASAEELMARAEGRHKGANLDYLKSQQENLRKLFGKHPNITELSTSSRSIADVVQAVCKIVHLADYQEFELAGRLRELAGKQ